MSLGQVAAVGVVARPVRRLGAASAFGLALPAAAPTAGQMYAPRGVWTDGRRLVVADTGNHRVLVWHDLPDDDGAPADVVLGQPDFTSEGAAAGGRGAANGLNLPTGVAVLGGRLVVADAWHHRLVVWDSLPQADDVAPDLVLGQPASDAVLPNAGGEPDLDRFYWPFGFGLAGGAFWVADTGNRRVLGWWVSNDPGDLPEPGRSADVLLGQDGPHDHGDNRGRSLGPDSFRWPHAVAGDGQQLLVADAGDHRVLGWSPVPRADRPSDLVLGQPDATTGEEFKNRPQSAARLRFPYAVALAGPRLVVADTANNRVLVWEDAPTLTTGVPADGVLGQPDVDANGENRWRSVEDDSLCWPYGLSLAPAGSGDGRGSLLAVADSGNNRVMLWRLW